MASTTRIPRARIARRAREHVAARRSRMQVDRVEQQAVVVKFMAALATGELWELVEALAPDVTLVADGGRIVPASR